VSGKEERAKELGILAEFATHSEVFFSYNKLLNNIFCHGLSAKNEENKP